MQAVGKLDQHHSYVIVERKQNAFEILCLDAFLFSLILIVENSLDLCETFNDSRNLVSEEASEVFHSIVGVLHDIVKQGGNDRLVAESDVAYYYFGTLTTERIKKRSEQMLSDFSNVVSKLALLTNAGMIMHEAWEEVAYTGDSEIYKEMQIAVDQMNNGVSEADALFNFGTRCVVPEIKKFTSTIVQGISKGNSELIAMLQEQSKEVWALKKQNVRRQGEKASSKLMIPMMIMFVGILIMVVVPIFANLGA
jgi:pilus assembly protein TadC